MSFIKGIFNIYISGYEINQKKNTLTILSLGICLIKINLFMNIKITMLPFILMLQGNAFLSMISSH